MGPTEEDHAVVVLAVEDDDAAYHLLAIALREVSPPLVLCRTADGQQAVRFLHQLHPFEEAPRPNLILLNRNLPKMSGIEVLAVINASASLRSIPVVVLTSSALDDDRVRCLALGARNFVTKPVDFDDLLLTLRSSLSFISF